MKKLTPFDHVKEIYKKNGEFLGDEGYVQYIINKELSKNPALLTIINWSQKHSLTNKAHFKMMNEFASLTPRPSYNKFPWIWKSENSVDKDVETLSRHYNESMVNAKEYLELLKLSNDGIDHLNWIRRIYGVDNTTKRGKNE